jgi:WD40 repeat protein
VPTYVLRSLGILWRFKAYWLSFGLWISLYYAIGLTLSVEPRAVILGNKNVKLVNFSPDSKFLLTRNESDEPFRPKGDFHFWDVDTGQECEILPKYWSEMDDVLFSPNNRLIAGCNRNSCIRLWDIQGKEVVGEIKVRTEFDNHVWCQFSPNSKILAFHDYQEGWQEHEWITFWDIEKKKVRGVIEVNRYHLLFSLDGKRLTTQTRDKHEAKTKVQVWDLGDESTPVSLVREYKLPEEVVAFAPDYESYVTIKNLSEDEKDVEIELWDLETGQLRAKTRYFDKETRIQGISFSPNGRLLVARCGGGGQLDWVSRTSIWDVQDDLRCLGTWTPEAKASDDGCWLAFPQETGAELLTLPHLNQREPLEVPGDYNPWLWSSYNGHHSSPECTFSPDSKWAVITGLAHDHMANPIMDWILVKVMGKSPATTTYLSRLWDVSKSQDVAVFVDDRDQPLFSPDGRTIATRHQDGSVKLWDLPIHKPRAKQLGWSFGLWFVAMGVVCLVRRMLRRKR